MKYLQQGDTLYFPIDALPDDLIDLKSDVVQWGETTHHAHRLHGEDFTILQEPKSKQKYLRLINPTMLKHEEHHDIKLPPGNYRIGIVIETDHMTGVTRQVAD